MLHIEGLSAGYGARPVLKDIEIKVSSGATVAVLGANTAGKTTLIRAIQGTVPWVRGRIMFGGADICGVPAHRRVAMGLAQVPEGRHVFTQMSVHENLLIGAYHRRRTLSTSDIEGIFALFPRLFERRDQMAGTLSGGEQQMVAIGRALMSRPRLLLLDEPSHGLAPLMVKEVRDAISRINRDGVAVLLVEQNVAAALSSVSHGYVLEEGNIAISGTADSLMANPKIREAYLGI